MAQLLPIASQKGKESLTGDLFTRTTTRTVGRGKKKYEVSSTTHVSPAGVGLGILALAGAAVAAGAALWMAQLKLTPTVHQQYKTVVDQPAYVETRPVAAVGHWAPNTTPVGEPVRAWQEGSWVKGTWKPGRWYTYQPVQTTSGEHWVVDVAEGVEKIPHPAVTHQEPTGKAVKRLAIEQRQPFSMSDAIQAPVTAVKEATGLDKPIFGDWSKGKIFARKWW